MDFNNHYIVSIFLHIDLQRIVARHLRICQPSLKLRAPALKLQRQRAGAAHLHISTLKPLPQNTPQNAL
jgi:hypothetical protein